jgi:hypothetical protein
VAFLRKNSEAYNAMRNEMDAANTGEDSRRGSILGDGIGSTENLDFASPDSAPAAR